MMITVVVMIMMVVLVKNQVNRFLDLLEKSFQVGINNGAKCDYNWSSRGRKVQ